MKYHLQLKTELFLFLEAKLSTFINVKEKNINFIQYFKQFYQIQNKIRKKIQIHNSKHRLIKTLIT
jgi:hypothetical protein